MNRGDSIRFIVLASLVNLVGSAFLFGRYIGCNDQSGCIGLGTTISAWLLGFPLDLVSWLWQKPGQPMSEWACVWVMVNSVLAAFILCLLLNVFLKKVHQNKLGSG
jgi:hypothetical protein